MKKGGIFRKILLTVFLGILFGACAGGSFYLINRLTTPSVTMKESHYTKELADEDVKEIQKEIESDEKQIEELKEWLLGEMEKKQSIVGITGPSTIVDSRYDMTEVVEKVMPSMVSISNEYVEYIDYFGTVYEQKGSASGSGIIVGENDNEFLIATNYHVIEGAEKLTVHFVDQEEVEAIVKGSDSDMDLAVIAVAKEKMSEDTKKAIGIASLGDSNSLKLGEPVVAIGNALGYGQSVTGGYVSALNREVQLSDGSTGTFIQTDAAINPGNSGGALLNMRGQVIGINSNKIGGTSIEGIGYAIPISAAQPILKDLMSYETRTKREDGEGGFLGLYPQTVSADVAEMYDMPVGVYVSQVEEGSPAFIAGIRKGDIILKIDKFRLKTAEDLRERLTYYSPFETIEVTLSRNEDGEYTERTVMVVLGKRPTE